MKQVKQLFPELNFGNPLLDDALIKKAEITKTSKELFLTVEFASPILSNELKEFAAQIKAHIKDKLHLEKLILYPKYLNPNLGDKNKAFYDEALKSIIKATPSLSYAKSFSYTFKDNTFEFIVPPKEDTKDFINAFEKYFKQWGLNILAKCIVDENLSSTAHQVKESIEKDTHQAQKSIISDKPKPNPTSTTSTTPSRKTTTQTSTIDQIPHDSYELDKYKYESGKPEFTIRGEILSIEFRKTTRSNLLRMTVFDDLDAIIVTSWINDNDVKGLKEELKEGIVVEISGTAEFDEFLKTVVLRARSRASIKVISKAQKVKRVDHEDEKRVEFHLHTNMSAMDGLSSASKYIEQLIDWGHSAAAFTDHNGVYAFPEIHKASYKKNFKPIYGVELDYCDETKFKFTTNPKGFDCILKEQEMVAFDIETTSLSAITGKIIEIAAYKFKNGEIISTYQTFVNPHEPLSAFTKELTGISDEDVSIAPDIDKALPEFLNFIKGCVLVAQNADFDHDFIKEKMAELKINPIDFAVIDTLNIGRYFYHDKLKRFSLPNLAKNFGITLNKHHRAQEDAKATAEVFMAMLRDLYAKGVVKYSDINKLIDPKEAYKHILPVHVTLLAQTQEGLKNLYKMVSECLTTNFYGRARLSNATLMAHRKGILLGSACSNGFVFEAALNKPDEVLAQAISEFDYIEVQPPESYLHKVYDMANRDELVKNAILRVIEFAKKQNKLIIATSNAHYLNPEDKMSRDIYIYTPSVGGGVHPLQKVLKEQQFSPYQYLLTTTEMKKAFEFLGKDDLIDQIVVKNTNLLNDKIDKVSAFSKDLYTFNDDCFKDSLGIASISDLVTEMVYQKAFKTYGQILPEIVDKRIKKELKSIIDNGFAPIYYMSYLLVKNSVDAGYFVGSRGSVGSSLVATLLAITEINPLPPHYFCPNGDFSVFKQLSINDYQADETDFIESLSLVDSGYDLPDCLCPLCGAKLVKEGQDIPFETFLGFDGDKTPDIDLNFSGDYQARAHDYVKELIGDDKSFRAGTIQTVQSRTAFGFVKGFLEGRNLKVRDAQVNRLASSIEGVRRSTSQHPGGIIIVPNDKEIYDVTPIQYPADNAEGYWYTTHFDYHSFEDNLIKLDVLGHDGPTIIKYLMDRVKANPSKYSFSTVEEIPVDDPKIYELFSSSEVLGIKDDEIYGSIASYAVPELGTNFVREMLLNTKPKNFAELVKISGLSHGTGVWIGNAFDLVLGKVDKYGKIPFQKIIGCRDDIMVQLIEYGVPQKDAFDIMEFVRRGSPVKKPGEWAGYVNTLKHYKVPDWYIWSCGKIEYMFPKAHASAYVLMAVRIAWFKVYDPLAFYSSYFSIRPVKFNYKVMVAGKNAIRNELIELRKDSKSKTKTDEVLIDLLLVAYEMTLRGFTFKPIDLNRSEVSEFVIDDNSLIMPFVSIDGLGAAAAQSVIDARLEKPFSSKADLAERTKLNKTILAKFEDLGILDHLDDKDEQINLGLFID